MSETNDVNALVIHDYGVFSQGVTANGPAILKHGKPLTPDEIVIYLNKLVNTVGFYADPEHYHAIAFLPDNPAGEFMTDFADNDDYDYPKPGARARKTVTELDV